MFRRVLLGFLALSVLETGLFVLLAKQTVWWAPFAWIGVSGVGGVWVLRYNGCLALGKRIGSARVRSLSGSPADWMLTTAGGILLIAPGILSDAAALFLLLPTPRRVIVNRLSTWMCGKFPWANSAANGFDAASDAMRTTTIDVPSVEAHENDSFR